MDKQARRAAFREGFIAELDRRGITPDQFVDGFIKCSDAQEVLKNLWGVGKGMGALGLGLAIGAPVLGGGLGGGVLYGLQKNDSLDQKKFETESQIQAYRTAARKLLEAKRQAEGLPKPGL